MAEEHNNKNKYPTGGGISVGIIVGVIIGVVIDNVAIGIAVGIAIGVALEGARGAYYKDKDGKQ